MGVFGIFKSKGFDPDTFEKELTQLTRQISNTQSQIYSLKGKSKRWVFSLSKIFLTTYALILVYIYQKVPRSPIARNKIVNFIESQSNDQLMVLVGFPVVGYLIVYLINSIFRLSVGRREKRLQTLKKKHSLKIEELKKITNFNTTNELLNKYGNQDVRKKSKDETGNKATAEKQVGASRQINSANAQQQQQQQQIIKRLQSLQENPPVQKPRTFQDRVLDFIVGSDNNEAIENRYALICKQCLTHNGLAPPGSTNPFKVSYICPNCGFLNGETEIEETTTPIETEELESNKATPLAVDRALHRPSIDDVMDKPSPDPVSGEPILIDPKDTHSSSFNRSTNESPLKDS
ncbi:DEHA2D07392p [Debaryomyces hansenii CBS767]|uniref:Endoplasmic reticulum junction formation protein lunapark n=1 Tax=Debaryomyces hansenii (strain ATCC 36239 / CBS 767 / BCRC 21394 / JCM 1990 / NBRC 0083 / IGC 2968) TaxID=284592 RepID=Q6BSN8_DEBHA|nr:DEHA2D07392p [Debaryomyces hansenii CBS767]CAG86926.2 DEHA2D07392p [Debaryomyces hansenii CBS767]|eukprot:XP_458782.2 DEHA2D07392p [Debaryomyces hansenii CBS767]